MTPSTSFRTLQDRVVVLYDEEKHERVMWTFERSVRLDSDPNIFYLNKGQDRELLCEAPILRVDKDNICYEQQDNGEWKEKGLLVTMVQAEVML